MKGIQAQTLRHTFTAWTVTHTYWHRHRYSSMERCTIIHKMRHNIQKLTCIDVDQHIHRDIQKLTQRPLFTEIWRGTERHIQTPCSEETHTQECNFWDFLCVRSWSTIEDLLPFLEVILLRPVFRWARGIGDESCVASEEETC